MPNWRSIFDPLTEAPTRFADDLAGYVDPQYGEGGMMKGFAAGAMQGAGRLASDMTSPFSLATSAIPALGRLKNLKSLAALKGLAPEAAAVEGIGPSEGLWGSIYGRPPAAPPRMPEAAGALERSMDFGRNIPVGPSESELAGQAVNRMHRTGTAMDRTAAIEEARRRSARMRPRTGPLPEEY